MDDTQAADILDAAEKSGLPFESFANEFYSMARRNLKNRLNAELIDQESYDRILSSDSYYVPFKGTLKSRTPRPAVLNVGKGISVTGKEFRRVMGRKSLPDNPVAQLLIDHVEGIIRSEKNKVAQSFLDFVREYGKDMILENGNPVFSVSKTRFMPVYNKDGDIIYMSPVITQDEKDGKVLSVKVNEAYKDPKTKVETKKNYTYKITIHDKALLEALKNMGAVRGIPVLRTYLNFLRSVTTMYNVDFLLPNFERDVETAFIHMSGKHGFKKASAIIKEVGSAIRGVWRSVREKTPTPYSDWYDRFKKVGGATGFYSIKNNEEICLEMERRVRHFNLTGKGWYRVLDSVRNVVKNANETVESATRLVYFKNLVEAGMSEKQAALAAKDLTVDFDLHGQWGTAINSMYLFANANLQGTWNAFSNIKNSKTVQGITAGIFFTSLLSSFFNRWVNPDEWEKMSQYNKDSNWAIMLPGGKMLVKRVAFVYNIPNTAGRVVDEYLHSEITLTEGMARMLEATTDAVNPLGSGSFFQVIAPTVLDPIVQVGENKNWNSVPIYKEQPMYSAKRPNSQMYFKSVSEPSRIATKFLNDITKQSGTGSRASGAIDINPEIIDHFVETFAGGLGRTIENSVTTATTLGKGEIPEMNSIPIVRTIVKEGSAWVQVSRARDLLEESGRTKYSLAVKKRFHHLINSARLSGLLKQEEADRMQREFDNNQKKIKQK
jgi:hypothetical protein